MAKSSYNGLATGVDIKTDKAIEETCKLANDSTNMTRSVIYTIFIVSVLAFVSYWNSRQNSWLPLRIKYNIAQEDTLLQQVRDSSAGLQAIIDKYCGSETQLADGKKQLNLMRLQLQIDSLRKLSGQASTKGELSAFRLYTITQMQGFIKDSINLARQMNAELCIRRQQYQAIAHQAAELHDKHEGLERIKGENTLLIHMPVLGVAVDVNDLGMVAGITFSLLMFILIFTLNREYSNLKLAFVSITRRYTDYSEMESFLPIYKSILLAPVPEDTIELAGAFSPKAAQKPPLNEQADDYADFFKKDGDFKEFVKEVNYIRRQHHYNFLSMNEVFTLPTLDQGDKEPPVWQNLTYLVFIPPLLIQGIITYYDFRTVNIAFKFDSQATINALVFDAIFLVIIGLITFACLRKKYHFGLLWNTFYKEGYRLVPHMEV